MIEDVFVGLVTLIMAVLTLMVAIWLMTLLYALGPGKWACEDFGRGMAVKSEYFFWEGCFVTMPNGERLPQSVATRVLQQRYELKTEQK